MTTSSKSKRVMMVAPRSTGGNFEYVAIPRQGLLFLSGALHQWKGDFLYDREIWYEDRSGNIDPDKDLEKTDIFMITALINEAPRAYEIAQGAKAHHPQMKMIGGGPHMGPLAEEALGVAGFDVIVQREAEDIIGVLCDTLLRYDGADLTAQLYKIPGISFMDHGQFVETKRRGVIAPDFVELPDFGSVKDLTPQNPMAAGVMETVRGCTEKCTYCQVIQQFLGYRLVQRETEFKRLEQLRKMAEDGLIYTARDGRFSVFISDDLHPPPLRAVKFRNERVARLKDWKGLTDDMWMICQTRAEIGQDPELAAAMWDAGIKMLYVGVESSSVKNLELVNKRQDPSQVSKDMATLNEMGFAIAAMTIIGLPYDTEETIMEMADWVKTVSRYQTANLLTPLPATINWSLPPLDEDGSILPEGKLRPYHLYTGRQLVFHDERWSMQESRDLYDRYTDKLHLVDTLYQRIFTLLGRTHGKVIDEKTAIGQQLSAKLIHRDDKRASIGELRESLVATIGQWEESVSAILKNRKGARTVKISEVRKLIATKTRELQDTIAAALGDMNDSLSSTRVDLKTTVGPRIDELKEIIHSKTGEIRESLISRTGELAESVSTGITELRDTLCNAISEFAGTLDVLSQTQRPARSIAG